MSDVTGRLESKVIVVTGGSSGIGRAVAQRAAAEGAAVVIGARGKDAGEQVAGEIRASGGQASFVPTDVTVEAEVQALVGAAVERFGRLDGAFNNAGGVSGFAPVQDVTAEHWHAELEQNLTGVFHSLKHQIPALLAAGGGAVVNNAAVAGAVGVGSMSPYVAAKHGVVGLTRATAMECAERGVRVNALITGTVDTPLFRGLLGAPAEGELDVPGLNPAGRVAAAAEIAAFVAFLLSDDAAFITGAALAIDGGFTAQ